MVVSIERLERRARAQLQHLYEETRRVGKTAAAVDRRAIDRVHELMSLTRSAERARRRQPSR